MSEIALRRPKWYARANEASFRATTGGYVFQRPSPWMLARPSYYLVTEAQKAELLEGLQRWRLLLMTASVVNLLVIAAIVLPMTLWPKIFVPYLVPMIRAIGPLGLGVTLVAAMLLLMAPLMIVAQVHLARVLRSGLAGAPLTDERITLRDQLPNIARSVPRFVIAIGLVGGLCMMGGSAIAMVDAYLEGHLARGAAIFGFGLGFGALLTAYFVWLIRLRLKQSRATA